MAKRDLLEDKRILIVDDEPDILETLEELLTMCEIIKATNFEEAKELLTTQYFDIAILDIMGVNGYALLDIATKRDVITIMLTAHALSPENIVKSYKEGAASYIPKDEMTNIDVFLNDALEAKKNGKNLWWRWYERMGSFCEKRFGPKWKDKDKEFWDKFMY
jgi:DNA-binding NtrC family response regulator